MEEVVLIDALIRYLSRYLNRLGYIQGGGGRVVTVTRAGYRSMDLASGHRINALVVFYGETTLAAAGSEVLEFFPALFDCDGISVPVVYESTQKPIEVPFAKPDVKKTIPDGVHYSVFNGRGSN
ncbi:MAG: hypothetical protein U9Q03_02595 [Patescibacteria group bacterium]|nr:hypothetical protein [Patescibacteria group bacterium]